MHQFRTHNCNQLNKSNIGSEVRISGWVNGKRDHGELLFLDIRDFYGITQAVIDASKSKEVAKIAKIRLESVVTITGKVVARTDETINKKISTGEIEIVIEKLELESAAEQIPFQIAEHNEHCSEDLRLKYRFLDLRRQEMQKNLKLRAKTISFLRNEMNDLGFLEVQTPILTSSSPEGARDFLVPSRLHLGKFYALPQAPQQFKQLLVTSGIDKYFQIAPCFRDEDARADRSPGEFYQLDMEMAFATQEDVFNVIEPVLKKCFLELGCKKLDLDKKGNFLRITYKEAMLKYGSDKPDLRIPLEIKEATDIFKNSGFKIFANNIEKGAVVRAIKSPKASKNSRKFFDDMIAFAISEGAGGLAYIIYNQDGTIKSPIAKLLGDKKLAKIKEVADLENGDAVFFACDKELKAANIAGKVRKRIAELENLIDNSVYKFCWVVDFPYFEEDEETGKIDFSHNPFSMPQGGMEVLEKQNPLDILAYQYDLVCNGAELSSGAIRNHKLEIMYKAFEIAGYSNQDVEKHFSALHKAFQFGAPPHGGFAPGIDRIVMLLADTENIREVIAFPMNGQAVDLLMDAPNYVNPKQLKELNINLSPKALKKYEEDNE